MRLETPAEVRREHQPSAWQLFRRVEARIRQDLQRLGLGMVCRYIPADGNPVPQRPKGAKEVILETLAEFEAEGLLADAPGILANLEAQTPLLPIFSLRALPKL